MNDDTAAIAAPCRDSSLRIAEKGPAGLSVGEEAGPCGSRALARREQPETWRRLSGCHHGIAASLIRA